LKGYHAHSTSTQHFMGPSHDSLSLLLSAFSK
jgi:hypothetical protein